MKHKRELLGLRRQLEDAMCNIDNDLWQLLGGRLRNLQDRDAEIAQLI